MFYTKAYKLILKFFNVFGILNIKFDGNKFIFSKFRNIVWLVLIIFNIIIWSIVRLKYAMKKNSEPNLTNFTKLVFTIFNGFVIVLAVIQAIALFISQKDIAKMFTIFHILIKLCNKNDLKIECDKLLQNVLFSFLIYNFFILFFVISSIKFYFVDENIQSVAKLLEQLFINFPNIVYSVESFLLSRLALVHFECLIENFNKILFDQVMQTHKDCKNIVANLIKIRKLFEILNNTFGRMFSIITITRFLDVIFMVIYNQNLNKC